MAGQYQIPRNRYRARPSAYKNTEHYKSGKKGKGSGSLRLEHIVRSSVRITSEPVERNVTAPDLVLPDANIRWGQAPDLGLEEFKEAERRGFNTQDPPDDDEERVRVTYTEEGRSWKDFRVENPDDPDQYAIVRSAQSVAFSGPQIDVWAGPAGKRQKYSVSGAQFLFKLNADGGIPAEQEEGSGQEPPAPPSLDEM